MPAKTPAQRRLFEAALAAKRGAEPISKKVADIASKTSEKELGKMASKPKKKVKKEGIEGAVDTVYAVQKPYSGCQLTSLVQPIDPLVGLGGSEIVPDNVHAVYPDQETAQNVAQRMYEEFQSEQRALEEKKIEVMEKIKKTMNVLERQRKESVKMIQENPKEAQSHKEKVANIATKMDHLVTQLQRIEASKKELEGDKEKKKEDKKKVEEALIKALTSK